MKRRLCLAALLASSGPRAGPAEDALWATRFPRPEGGELALASLRGRPMLINFWATWCAPCVKELPDLDRFAAAHPDWQVLGLAIDGPTPVREFLAKHPVGFPIALAGLNGSELARTLGNKLGGMPFSVALDAQGTIRWRHLGVTRPAELEALARTGKTKG